MPAIDTCRLKEIFFYFLDFTINIYPVRNAVLIEERLEKCVNAVKLAFYVRILVCRVECGVFQGCEMFEKGSRIVAIRAVF